MSSQGFCHDDQTNSQYVYKINESYLVKRVAPSISLLGCVKRQTSEDFAFGYHSFKKNIGKAKIS